MHNKLENGEKIVGDLENRFVCTTTNVRFHGESSGAANRGQ